MRRCEAEAKAKYIWGLICTEQRDREGFQLLHLFLAPPSPATIVSLHLCVLSLILGLQGHILMGGIIFVKGRSIPVFSSEITE
jgi:hypothetical protein